MNICLGDSESDCLTNLRFADDAFADDALLFSTSQVPLQKMMCDFKQSTERVGLKIHPDKTKILSNQSSNRRKEMEINNIKDEMIYYLRAKVRNILDKQLRSKIESERLAHRSTDTNKS